MNAIPDPKVVLATPVDMENGFSRDLFVHMSNHPKNMIILTSRTPPGTLARKLIDSPSLTSIMLEMKKRINLQGAELDEFERQREAEKLEKAKIKQEEADSSDESDAEDSATRQAPHDIMISHETTNKEGGFFKKARKAFPMFPFQEDRMKWDDYGELISGLISIYSFLPKWGASGTVPVVSILLHAEFGRYDQGKDAPHFMTQGTKTILLTGVEKLLDHIKSRRL